MNIISPLIRITKEIEIVNHNPIINSLKKIIKLYKKKILAAVN